MSSAGKGIPPEILQQIRDRVDIVDVVSRYVTLSKTGQNFKGLCPFHSEKTPSFSVSPTRQMFYCFGCGVGGDAFTFLMNREGLGFMEVVTELAQQAGVSIPAFNPRNPDYRASSERERYEQMYDIATLWFQEKLHNAESGKDARLYLKNRGLDSSVLQEFRIGYAQAEWNDLSIHLGKKGFTQNEILRSGLVATKDSTGQNRSQRHSHYDRFRDRIMFPIANSRDRIVAFGGRTLHDEGTPKYLNSPETSFFSKGRMLYGLGQARKFVGQLERLFLVEGYFDVIALSQAGVKNVVAPLGTAMTSEHVQIIRRLAKTVVLLFDGDAAGVNAALRTLDLFLNTGVTVRVMVLPQGDDPDTFIRRQGIEDFLELESRAAPLLDFAVTTCLDQKTGDSTGDRIRKVDEVLHIIQKTTNPVEKAEYIGVVSDRLSIRQHVLIERFPTLKPASPRRAKEKAGESIPDGRGAVPKGNPEERDLVILLLNEKLDPQYIQELQSHMFQEAAYRGIIEMALSHVGEEGILDYEAFRAEVFHSEELAPMVAHLALKDYPSEEASLHAKGCLDGLKRKHLKMALDGLIIKLRLAEQEQRKEDVDRLIHEIDRLRDQKAALVGS